MHRGGKRRSTTVFSRDEIGVEQLQSLKEKFADGDLNEKEFVSLFREIIDGSLSETQLTELFQKIDANSDGTVDWDELTNYMFLSGSDNNSDLMGDDSNAVYDTYQPDKLGGNGGNDMDGAGNSTSSSNPSTAINSGSSTSTGSSNTDPSAMRPMFHHKDLITRVIRLEKPALYLTTSKDGSVRTWNAHTLQFQNVLTTGKNWLTDCCLMRRSNRLAVTSMNRTLGIYDLNSNALIGEIHEYSKRQCIPLCVEYVEKPADDREALVIGDDTGGITVMTCSDQWLACDGRSNTATNGTSTASDGTNTSVNSTGSSNITLETHGFSSRTKFRKHTDWVTRVKWVNDIRAIVATSLDTTISIIDIDRMMVKFEYNRHKKGVFDLVWCSSTRLIASCGMERDISIWNPYSSQRAVATLRGHTSSVVHLASDDDNYQLISVSSDNMFKVWDVRNHRCLQTWMDKSKSTGGAEHRISSLFFDSKYPCLLSGTTHLTRWPYKRNGDEMNEHGDIIRVDTIGSGGRERSSCLAKYNGVFHQVVTAEMSTESIIKTWSAETGDEICSFGNAHGQNPVTAISFDYPGRRLLTGAHDGTLINMWNFSNGALVKQFLKEEKEKTLIGIGTSSGNTGNGTSSTSSATRALEDLSFLGIHDDEDSTRQTHPIVSTSSSTAMSSTPRRRKVRDIMLLPPHFGLDWNGRKNVSGLDQYPELPSPTRKRFRPKDGQEENVTSNVRRSKDNPTTSPSDMIIPVPPTTLPTQVPSTRTTRLAEVESTSSDTLPTSYCEKEVTCLLDIERNLRVGMGDYICQRFVCSVGWDRHLYIWADKNEESEALPLHMLPKSTSCITKYHTMDILVLVFIPPAYIATTGLDGKILLWSLNSGEYVSKLYQSTGSIDTMIYAQKIDMLFAAGETGQLICIDRSMTLQALIPLAHPQGEAITAIQCDTTNTHVITGDAAGHLKLWDITIAMNHEGLYVELCCEWHIGSTRVLNLDFIEYTRLTDVYLLVSCASGDVSIWTLDGIQVGCFGRHKTWQLGKPLTYLSTISSCTWKEEDAKLYRTTHYVKNMSIAALNGNDTTSTFLIEDTMPKPGEVWICLSNHRVGGINLSTKHTKQHETIAAEGVEGTTTPVLSRRQSSLRPRLSESGLTGEEEQNTSLPTLGSLEYLTQRLHEVTSDMIDLITIVKVTRGEISCWDGNRHSPPLLKVIEMSEFVRKPGWIKQPLLSQYIGRCFSTESSYLRVNSIMIAPLDGNKPDRKMFSLVDMFGQAHPIRPLSESIPLGRLKRQETLTRRQHSEKGNYSSDEIQASNGRKQTISKPTRRSSTEAIKPVPTVSSTEPTTSDPANSINEKPNSKPLSAMVTASSTIHSLPLLKSTEKRGMSGLLPKRSAARMRHDQTIDFRRIHTPEDIPKNFRVAINQKLMASNLTASDLNNQHPVTSGGNTSRHNIRGGPTGGKAGGRFDGVIPE